jgi:hypothetical protein
MNMSSKTNGAAAIASPANCNSVTKPATVEVLRKRRKYNRAGVERVMGFCTEDEYREFLLPTRQRDDTYVRPPMAAQRFVGDHV